MNYLELAKKCALDAGDLLLKYLGKIGSYELKSHNSLLTEADLESENLIIGEIKSYFPEHSFHAEESGRDINDSGYLWLIDPLDGTTNFAHSYPFFSVSIALQVNGTVEVGVVYDPVKHELFYAEKGRGSFLNDKQIAVSIVSSLDQSHLVTGFVHEHRWMVEKNLKYFEKFILSSQAVRRDGSAALDLCYVASGRYDGFWEMGLNPWDTAAGVLIAREAGGIVTDFTSNDFKLESYELLASNNLIHKNMVDMLKD